MGGGWGGVINFYFRNTRFTKIHLKLLLILYRINFVLGLVNLILYTIYPIYGDLLLILLNNLL